MNHRFLFGIDILQYCLILLLKSIVQQLTMTQWNEIPVNSWYCHLIVLWATSIFLNNEIAYWFSLLQRQLWSVLSNKAQIAGKKTNPRVFATFIAPGWFDLLISNLTCNISLFFSCCLQRYESIYHAFCPSSNRMCPTSHIDRLNIPKNFNILFLKFH